MANSKRISKQNFGSKLHYRMLLCALAASVLLNISMSGLCVELHGGHLGIHGLNDENHCQEHKATTDENGYSLAEQHTHCQQFAKTDTVVLEALQKFNVAPSSAISAVIPANDSISVIFAKLHQYRAWAMAANELPVYSGLVQKKIVTIQV